jgi:putative nucleotidyltransferase with HDIG domain
MAERILIVDDEKEIRKFIISTLVYYDSQDAPDGLKELLAPIDGLEALAPIDCDCREAADGLEALALLNSGEKFDLVLAEVMPNLGGIGLLGYIRDWYPDVTVVMVSAVHDIQVALQAIRNGAYDYLLKPFEPEQLLPIVRRALEHRRLKRENDAYRANLEALVATRTQSWETALTDLERAYDITLEGFGSALALRDPETGAHSKRVTAFTIAIAQKMGLSKEDIRVIARGAFLHDIGKLAIPEKILTKPGKLTPDEVDVMKEHVWHGYKIIKNIPFLSEAAEIVYSHQERFDGTGYPRRLKGEEIPLGARIVAVANTLDAMTSDQPYRSRQTFEVARKEIKFWSGRQFDPQIVEVFLGMPDNIWEDFRKDI